MPRGIACDEKCHTISALVFLAVGVIIFGCAIYVLVPKDNYVVDEETSSLSDAVCVPFFMPYGEHNGDVLSQNSIKESISSFVWYGIPATGGTLLVEMYQFGLYEPNGFYRVYFRVYENSNYSNSEFLYRAINSTEKNMIASFLNESTDFDGWIFTWENGSYNGQPVGVIQSIIVFFSDRTYAIYSYSKDLLAIESTQIEIESSTLNDVTYSTLTAADVVGKSLITKSTLDDIVEIEPNVGPCD